MPFPSSKKSHFQNEAKYKNFLLKTRFFSPRIKNHSLINGFTLGRDCETVRIFAYSSARKQSNKMSWARLKRESETGRDARHSRVWNSYATDWEKNRLFCSPHFSPTRKWPILVIKNEEFKLTNSQAFLESRSKCLNERWSDESGIHQASVVQKVDSAIQRIHLYPAESAIGFPKTYPLQVDRKWTCLKIPPWFRVHFRAGGLCQSKDANYYEIGSIIVIIMTITKFSNLIGYQLSWFQH